MEINVRKDHKIVEVWLTNAEKNDPKLRESLKPMYQEYKKQQYLVAVFLSGNEDLTEMTSALLCTNRKRMAAQEVQRQKQQAMGV